MLPDSGYTLRSEIETPLVVYLDLLFRNAPPLIFQI
jgi:hypothetical protein